MSTKAEIVERETTDSEDMEGRKLAVDLVIGDQTIGTGDTAIESFNFWDKLEGQVQRALYRIKTKNTNLSFDFNINTMMLSKEEKEKCHREGLIKHMEEKCPGVDVAKVLDIFQKEIDSMEFTGPDDNHPNPYLKFPVDGDISKMLAIVCIHKYNKESE